jgi:hypothetical protein
MHPLQTEARRSWTRLIRCRHKASPALTDNKLASPNVTTYHYDDVGNLEYFIYPNGLKHAFSYTEQNRLKSPTLSRGDGSLVRDLPGVMPST